MLILILKNKRITRAKGSFTVEAAYLIPISLLLFAVIFKLAMGFTTTIHDASVDMDALQQLDTLDYFLKAVQLHHIKDLLLGR